MEYSKEIKYLLGDSKSYVTPTIEDPKTLLKVTLDFLLGHLCGIPDFQVSFI